MKRGWPCIPGQGVSVKAPTLPKRDTGSGSNYEDSELRWDNSAVTARDLSCVKWTTQAQVAVRFGIWKVDL